MASNDNGAALLLAFIAGAVTGAAAALLFAPATGEDTRSYIGDRAREGRDNLTTAFERTRQPRPRPADEPQA